jgi:hypothetical protein
MKKLFFTAIALVAFSGISMASIVEKGKVVTYDCSTAYDRPFRNVINGGGTQEQADRAGKAAVAACEKKHKKQLTTA